MATFEIFQSHDRQYGWRLRAANGETIATSGTLYVTKAAAQRAIEAVKRAALEASSRDLTQA